MRWKGLRGVPWVLSIALTVASLPVTVMAGAEATAADLETARDLYREGRDLRDKGDLPGALEKLRAANALAGTPITGLEVGRTYMMVGRLVEARQALLDVGRIPIKVNESANAKAARVEAEKLATEIKPRIPQLLVVVTGVPAGLTPTVTIDGAPIPAEALSVAHKLDPGSHVVAARVGTGKTQTSTVVLKEGESREVQLVLPPEPVAQPTPSKLRAEPASNYTLSYLGFGVAGAGLIVGSVTGFLVVGKARELRNRCPEKECPLATGPEVDSAKTLGTVSTISFAVASAGAVVGVIGLFLGRSSGTASSSSGALRPSVSVFVGLSSAGLQGTF